MPTVSPSYAKLWAKLLTTPVSSEPVHQPTCLTLTA